MPQPVDLLLRLETIQADLDRFKRAVGYSGRDACPLRSERVASQKPAAVPTGGLVRRLLASQPALLQSVCNIYIQDFLCLGYPLPEGCDVAPRAPSTLDDDERRADDAGGT